MPVVPFAAQLDAIDTLRAMVAHQPWAESHEAAWLLQTLESGVRGQMYPLCYPEGTTPGRVMVVVWEPETARRAVA